MSKQETQHCYRCAAVLLPGAEVCATCCAPQTDVAAQPFSVPSHEPVVAQPDPRPDTGLAAWPFGTADVEAAAEVAAQAVATDVRGELTQYSAQSATHVLATIPAQRPEPEAEVQSVPSVGPNPFLAAARIQHAREDADAIEGYPA